MVPNRVPISLLGDCVVVRSAELVSGKSGAPGAFEGSVGTSSLAGVVGGVDAERSATNWTGASLGIIIVGRVHLTNFFFRVGSLLLTSGDAWKMDFEQGITTFGCCTGIPSTSIIITIGVIVIGVALIGWFSFHV